jgi:hypothetical protein
MWVKVGMAQDLLHDGQRHAGPDQFHGPGMAQDVRMGCGRIFEKFLNLAKIFYSS